MRTLRREGWLARWKIPGHLKRLLHPRLVSTRACYARQGSRVSSTVPAVLSPQALGVPLGQSDGPRAGQARVT